MARRQVVEIVCDRCGKIETQEPSQASKEVSPEFVIKFHEESRTYEDLCMRCRRACEGYYKSATKQIEKEEAEARPQVKKPGILGLGKKTG